MRNINKECVRQFGEGIDEELIKEYMVTKKSMLPETYIQVMNQEIKSFLTMVVNSLREEKYSLKTTPFVFVGGGAVVMKNFGGYDQENFSYNTDICANAKGFEQLAEFRVSKGVMDGGS